MSDDPDALWKPGYDGGYRAAPRDSSTVEPRRSRGGRRAGRVAIVVLTVAIVSTVIALAVTPRDDGEATLTEPWSVTLAGTTVGALTVTSDRVVALVGRPASVVVLDLADGAEQWRRPAPGDSATGLDVVPAGDHQRVVVVRHVDADGTGSALVLDLATGVTQWRSALAVGERLDVADDELRRRSVRATANGPAGSQQIDAASGEVVRELSPDDAEVPATDNVVRRWGTAYGSRRAVWELPDGLLAVTVDPSVDATTISFEPTPPA